MYSWQFWILFIDTSSGGFFEVLKSLQTVALDIKDLKQQTSAVYKNFTPSSALKSENNNEFVKLFSTLKLAYSPALSTMSQNYVGPNLVRYAQRRFNFKWADSSKPATIDGDEVEEDNDEAINNTVNVDTENRILEKTAYKPLMQYLESLNLPCADVSDGERCLERNLFHSDVFTLRKSTAFSTATMRLKAQAPVFIQTIKGRSDIIILSDKFLDQRIYHKAHVRVAVEVKTIKGLKNVDGALREAAIQLVGLNVNNTEATPVVLLTNFTKKHFVLYLTLSSYPEENLSYNLHIVQFKTFESSLEFAEIQSLLEPISSYFGGPPTPPASVAENSSLIWLVCFRG